MNTDHPDNQKQLHIAEHYGFCTGVKRAIELFNDLVSKKIKPIYVLYELVHNNDVTRNMTQNGAVFVDDIQQVPRNATLLLGTHGVPKSIIEQTKLRNLKVYDTTCPLVENLHRLAQDTTSSQQLVLFGTPGHHEAVGIIGHAGTTQTFIVTSTSDIDCLPELTNPVLLVQTTMDDDLAQSITAHFKQRFPNAHCPSAVCNASKKRQEAIVTLARVCDLVLVVGSSHSSNANRLCERARALGVAAKLVENSAQALDAVGDAKSIGLTAGASTPDEIFQDVKNSLIKLGFRQNDN